MLWMLTGSFVAVLSCDDWRSLMRYFPWGLKYYSSITFGPVPVFTSRGFGCNTIRISLIPIWTLYVHSVRNATSVNGTSNFTFLSTVVDCSFFPAATMILALFLTPCTNWFSDFVGFALLPPSVTYIATFPPSIVSLGPYLPFVLGSSTTRLVGRSSRLRQDPPRHPSALVLQWPISRRLVVHWPWLPHRGCRVPIAK